MINDKDKNWKTTEEQKLQSDQLTNRDATVENNVESESKLPGNNEVSKDDDQEGWVRLESGLGINE